MPATRAHKFVVHAVDVRLSLSLTCLTSHAITKVLEVGLFHGEEPSEVVVSPETGSYAVLGNGLHITDLKKGEKLHVRSENGLVIAETRKKCSAAMPSSASSVRPGKYDDHSACRSRAQDTPIPR